MRRKSHKARWVPCNLLWACFPSLWESCSKSQLEAEIFFLISCNKQDLKKKQPTCRYTRGIQGSFVVLETRCTLLYRALVENTGCSVCPSSPFVTEPCLMDGSLLISDCLQSAHLFCVGQWTCTVNGVNSLLPALIISFLIEGQ